MSNYRQVLAVPGVDNVPLKRSEKAIADYRRSDLEDYESVRYGMPEPGLVHAELTEHLNRLISSCSDNGYNAQIPEKIPVHLFKAVKVFRATLDCYYAIVESPIFSKEEVYLRCLEEGPAFTEYLKKCRSTTLRYVTSETETDIDEDYVCSGYKGYDSIIHERCMIHWDDREAVDDIMFSFIPTKEVNEEVFDKMVMNYFDSFKLEEEDFDLIRDTDMLTGLQPTSMYDPKTGKTRMMREFWSDDIDVDEPWMGKRSVVLTHPGSTRDALVGTPSTVARVKMLNKLARVVSERGRHSANVSGTGATDRYLRVLKRNWFMHLDFKKYGLMFPRKLTNVVIREVCRRAGIDSANLIIDEMYICIGDETYRSERGTALGWLDAINAIAVDAILHELSVTRGCAFDWVGFNDDFELSFYDSGDMRILMNAMRELLMFEFDHWDIGLSADKIYGSRASVFLEQYNYFPLEYELDMRKCQLAASAYASSLVSKIPWIAKLNFAAAWRVVENDYCRDRCFTTCPIEFDGDEIYHSVELGGWYDMTDPLLSESLTSSADRYLHLGGFLFKITPKDYSAPSKKVSSKQDIRAATNEKAWTAHSPEWYRHTVQDPGKLEDVNLEAENAPQMIEYLFAAYTGKLDHIEDVLVSHVRRRCTSGDQPPPSEVGGWSNGSRVGQSLSS